jgi:hypothetical protein
MRENSLVKSWTNQIDPSTIPDEVIASERGKRNNAKRKTYGGCLVWGKHNPDVKYCRCERCNARRAEKKVRR